MVRAGRAAPASSRRSSPAAVNWVSRSAPGTAVDAILDDGRPGESRAGRRHADVAADVVVCNADAAGPLRAGCCRPARPGGSTPDARRACARWRGSCCMLGLSGRDARGRAPRCASRGRLRRRVRRDLRAQARSPSSTRRCTCTPPTTRRCARRRLRGLVRVGERAGARSRPRRRLGPTRPPRALCRARTGRAGQPRRRRPEPAPVRRDHDAGRPGTPDGCTRWRDLRLGLARAAGGAAAAGEPQSRCRVSTWWAGRRIPAAASRWC